MIFEKIMKSTQVLIFLKNMKNAKGEFTDADFEGRDFTDADCKKNDEVLFCKSVLNYGGVLEE